MKTSTMGFVLLHKPTALNLHGSSQTLPQEPVGARQVQPRTNQELPNVLFSVFVSTFGFIEYCSFHCLTESVSVDVPAL